MSIVLNFYMITREEFVRVCTQAIQETRRDIAISNQRSGYLKYHEEFRKNDYLHYARSLLCENVHFSGYSLEDAHEIIKATKIGNCGELAEYLSIEILEKLRRYRVNPTVLIVKSRIFDHEFLHILIQLYNEA